MTRPLGTALLLLAALTAPLAAQAPPPLGIFVYSTLTFEPGFVVSECAAVADPLTASLYRGYIPDCDFPTAAAGVETPGPTPSQPQCRSWEGGSCAGSPSGSDSGTDSGTDTPAGCGAAEGTDVPAGCTNNVSVVPVVPGELYILPASFFLAPGFDPSRGYYTDPLGYSFVDTFPPFPVPAYTVFPVFFPPVPENPAPNCIDPFCSFLIAVTSDVATAEQITPAFDSLGPTQSANFAANQASAWFQSGPGTFTSTPLSAHYTAPTHIPNEQTAHIQACDPTRPGNCTTADVNLIPIDVFVSPQTVDLIPGVPQKFTASINFTNLTSGFAWSATPASNPSAIDASGNYTPPAQVTSPLTVTIKACSTVDDQRCGTATATVRPVTINVTAAASIILASPGAALQFFPTVFGTSQTDVTWSLAPANAPGAIDANGLYRVPLAPVLVAQQTVQIKACLKANAQLCSPAFNLTLVPPVVIANVMPVLSAGQSVVVNVTGSGFGASPEIKLSDPLINFTVASAGNAAIQIVATTPTLTPSETVAVTVTDTTSGLFLAPKATFNTSVVPVTLTPTITPATATLQEGQSQQLTATFNCRTSGGVTCSVPQAAIWVLNPSLGTITADGLYTATASIGAQTQVVGKACAAVNPLACTPNFLITLVPTNVTVTPAASPPLADGRTQQFTAAVTGNNVTSVVWSINPPVGTIGSTGLYTAPNPVPSQQAVTVKACSTVDGLRCGTAVANLIAVRLSPATLTFAPLAVGSTSAAQPVTLSNGSSTALAIAGIGIAAAGGDFTLGAGGTCGPSLAPGGSCTINVVFSPLAAGARPGSLVVTHSAGNSPQSVALSGTGTQIALSPTSLTFDPQSPGTASAPKTVTLTNGSPTPLAMGTIGLPAPFTQTNDCGPTLAANASCTFTVTFAPTVAGAFSATLTVNDSAANSPQTASVSGTAIQVPSLIGLSPSAVTVGSTGFTLLVSGSNFASLATVVQVNGAARPTTFVSPSQLKAAIPASDLATVGTLSITVLNPGPAGGQSGAQALSVVTTPIPLVGSLSPPHAVAGGAGLTLLVNGSNFAAGSAVLVNGASRTATFINSGQLAVALTAADLAHSALLPIGVATPAAGNSVTTVPFAAFRYGDLNFDDTINVTDLSVLANFLAGNLVLQDAATADLNLDGVVNVSDLSILANYLAGNIHTLPVTP